MSVFFITGASSGLCKAIALHALSRNHKVIACARDTASLQDLQKAGAHVHSLDVTAPEADIVAQVKQLAAVYGSITHLINGAGFLLQGMGEELSDEEVYRHFNTNVFGTMRVTRAVLPYLRSSAASSGSPSVIANFGSMGSWTGWPLSSAYVSTKWAVSGWTESLAAEVAPFNVRALVVEPGTFRTNFLNSSAGRRVLAQKKLDEYKDMREAIGSYMDSQDGSQPGDPEKAAKVILDVVTATGCAEGKEIPLRLPLGSDAIETIGKKCKDTQEVLEQWGDIIKSTDF